MSRQGKFVMGATVLTAAVVGMITGLGSFTFVYARGASYLTNDPAACANCHIMGAHYDAWRKSSHHAVAVCNDCHAPHDLIGKYMTKAENGFWHSWAFTTGWFHEPIQIRERNRAVTQRACLHCHEDIVQAMHPGGGPENVSCIHCHDGVGHMR